MKRMRRLIKSILSSNAGFWMLRSLLISNKERAKASGFLDKRQGDIAFILGTGRSGTQLITEALLSTGQAAVFHEPNFVEDVGSMEGFYLDQYKAIRYWNTFRKYEIYKRWSENPATKIYGEVNGTIRYQIPGILSALPESKIFLVARDGRGVVRSVMGWKQFYGEKSKGAYALKPHKSDPYYVKWERMTRFEKICWSWMDSNEYLLKFVPENRIYKLEDLVKDYEEMSRLLSDIGISIGLNSWERIVTKPSRNSSKEYSFPVWGEWSKKEQSTFVEICGKTMAKLGYHIN